MIGEYDWDSLTYEDIASTYKTRSKLVYKLRTSRERRFLPDEPENRIHRELNRSITTVLTAGSSSDLEGLDSDFLKNLPNKGNPDNPLMLACRNPNPSCCLYLLSKGRYVVEYLPFSTAKIDDQGRTALHIAVMCNNVEPVRAMIQIQPLLVNVCDFGGDSPLHYAIRNNNSAISQMLLPLSNLEALNASGKNALHFFVCMQNCTDVFGSLPKRQRIRAAAEKGTLSQFQAEGGLLRPCSTAKHTSTTKCQWHL